MVKNPGNGRLNNLNDPVLNVLTTALEGGEGSASRPGPSLPRKRPGIHYTGGWVGPRAVLDECGESRPHLDLIPGPSSP